MNLVRRNVIDVSSVNEKKNSIAVVPLRPRHCKGRSLRVAGREPRIPEPLQGFSRAVRSQRTNKNVHDHLQPKQTR
jgi:hypothetical protein